MEKALLYEMVGAIASNARSELDDVDQLLRVYRGRVFRYAMISLKDRDLAESVTQDCFLKAFNNRAQYRAECTVSTWLFKIATNLIRDHTRTRRFQFWKRARLSSVDATQVANRLIARQASPEVRLMMQAELGRVWNIVDSLPQRQRTVFLLRFVEEMEIAEIAQATGIKLGTVKSHLHRALSSVRAGMQGAGT